MQTQRRPLRRCSPRLWTSRSRSMQRSAEILTLREASGLAAGPGLLAHRSAGAELDYFAYVPRNATPDSPLLVTVHGIERLALQHVVRFSRLAEQHGFLVL